MGVNGYLLLGTFTNSWRYLSLHATAVTFQPGGLDSIATWIYMAACIGDMIFNTDLERCASPVKMVLKPLRKVGLKVNSAKQFGKKPKTSNKKGKSDLLSTGCYNLF